MNMWNVLCINTETLMLGLPVAIHDAIDYANRYQKTYPQYEFDVVRVKTLPADWLPSELHA